MYAILIKHIPSNNCPDSFVVRLRVAVLKIRMKSCGRNVNIQPGVTIENLNNFSIGNNSGLGRNSYIRALAPVTFGNDVMVGPELHVYTTSHYHKIGVPMNTQGGFMNPVIVKDDVWIGARVTLLQGVTVESGCVIAAGAVVNRSTKPNGIYGGVPARRLRDRT